MPFKGASPLISQESFVAPNATIVGNVTLGDESGVWYGSVVRGDENAVSIGSDTRSVGPEVGIGDDEVGGDASAGGSRSEKSGGEFHLVKVSLFI